MYLTGFCFAVRVRGFDSIDHRRQGIGTGSLLYEVSASGASYSTAGTVEHIRTGLRHLMESTRNGAMPSLGTWRARRTCTQSSEDTGRPVSLLLTGTVTEVEVVCVGLIAGLTSSVRTTTAHSQTGDEMPHTWWSKSDKKAG